MTFPDVTQDPSGVLEDLLMQRFSTRAFRSQPVPRDVINDILRLAQRSPSWCNTQPWQLDILSGAAAKRFQESYFTHVETAPEAPDFMFPTAYEGNYQQRRRSCGLQLYKSLGITVGDRQASARQTRENYRSFGAPHVAILTCPAALGCYAAVDCGVYLLAFLLAARAHGVDSLPQAALASHPDFVRGELNLSRDRKVLCGIAFGYADREAAINQFRTERATVEEVVRWHDL